MTPHRRAIITVIFALLLYLPLSPAAWAIPSMLNSIPTTDVTGHRTLILMENYYKYNYKETDIPCDSSLIHGLQFGYRNVEFGVDFVGKRDFEDLGMYPSSWNAKWRIFSETASAPFSLAVGTFYLGAKRVPGLEDDAYKPSPYLVAAKTLGNWRLTLGYQKSLFGFSRVDTHPITGFAERRNDGLLAGLDGVIIRHAKNPVTLMLDYYGGPLATWGFGLSQPFMETFNWSFCWYQPVKDKLPDSGAESPTQVWFGISYNWDMK